MRKLIFIALIAGSGYWYHKNIYSLPIYGEWSINEQDFMRKAHEKSPMTTEQEAEIREYVSNTRIVISRTGSAEFNFPDRGGKFPYELTKSTPGCYFLEVGQLGRFEACVEGDSMKMENTETGYTELFDRI